MKLLPIVVLGTACLIGSLIQASENLPLPKPLHKPPSSQLQYKDTIITHSKGAIKSIKTNKTKIQHIRKTQKH